VYGRPKLNCSSAAAAPHKSPMPGLHVVDASLTAATGLTGAHCIEMPSGAVTGIVVQCSLSLNSGGESAPPGMTGLCAGFRSSWSVPPSGACSSAESLGWEDEIGFDTMAAFASAMEMLVCIDLGSVENP